MRCIPGRSIGRGLLVVLRVWNPWNSIHMGSSYIILHTWSDPQSIIIGMYSTSFLRVDIVLSEDVIPLLQPVLYVSAVEFVVAFPQAQAPIAVPVHACWRLIALARALLQLLA